MIQHQIYVESDACHPYDQNPQDSVYPEQGISTRNNADVYRDYGSDSHSFYRFWEDPGICGTAGSILCISDSVYFAVYGTGNQSEKSVCKKLWRTFINRRKGAGQNELDTVIFKTFWENRAVWN